MSCIYGPHQCGNEDQGWVAHFVKQAIEGKPITLYGDGYQVRDLLFVQDLVNAMIQAQSRIEEVSGHAFNIGGGARNTVSLIELIRIIEQLHGQPIEVSFGSWRTGDQRYYVSDTGKFQRATGWNPRTTVQEGLERLHRWLTESRRPGAVIASIGGPGARTSRKAAGAER